MESESRTFSRVKTYLRGRLRRIHSAEAPYLFNGVPAEGGLNADALKEARLSDGLVDFLLQMDHKLDAILSHLNRGLIQDDFPIPVEVLDISGAGVRFVSSQTFTPGEHVEITLVLNQFPLRMAGAIGRVARVANAAEAGSTPHSAAPYSVALDFVRIREADLEAVVHFVFNEERKQIREKKWD
ncbi:MAG: PilZ domain-containing protein [Desulfovibrionaceae bacterium]|jgi:hypothetical protein|nr:PilZ domain-containing protein [Desulfovibrionaceae bacterium]